MLDQKPENRTKEIFQEKSGGGIRELGIRSAYNAMAWAINIPSKLTQKLLLRAIDKGNVDMTVALVKHGANVNSPKEYRRTPKEELNRTPIFHAVDSGNLEMVNTLIELGADVTHVAERNGTPLQRALDARIINMDIANVLIEAGVDVNSKDIYGRTLLHWATDSGSIEKINALIKLGADPDIKDKDGYTPRSAARKFKKGATAIHFALNGSRPDDSQTMNAEIYEFSRNS